MFKYKGYVVWTSAMSDEWLIQEGYAILHRSPSMKEAKRLERKLARIANMHSNYRFRLGAILASDTRLGKVWPVAGGRRA